MGEQLSARLGPRAFVVRILVRVALSIIEDRTHLIGQLGITGGDGIPKDIRELEPLVVRQPQDLLQKRLVDHDPIVDVASDDPPELAVADRLTGNSAPLIGGD